ncbi:MAG TPA: hypothetical protein VGO07_01640 [Candidatus Saccharimonadales bacterium]|jgi:hypothetical protein|nr:hypothetical protein [Candidatus Saccharimonadales bacterium]
MISQRIKRSLAGGATAAITIGLASSAAPAPQPAVNRLGNGAVTLTLTRAVPASPDGFSTRGNYLLGVTATEGPNGITGGSVSAMRVAETAGTSGKTSPDDVTVFDMRATADTENGNWIVTKDDFAGYSMQGNTGASLAEPQAGDIVRTAINVVSNEHSGEPVTYHS